MGFAPTGLSSAMKKEALERVVANYGYQPTLFYESSAIC